MKKFYTKPLALSLAVSMFWISLVKHEDTDRTRIQRLKQGEILSDVRLLPNSKVFKCKLIGLIPASLNKVWKVISDYSHYMEEIHFIFTTALNCRFRSRTDILSSESKGFLKYSNPNGLRF